MNNTCGNRIPLRLKDLNPNCIDLVVVFAGYIVPTTAVIVLVTNILIVSVFARQRVRSHTTCILMLIATVDALNIVIPSTVYVYHYALGRNIEEFLPYPLCRWTYILGDICVDMFNMISLWLTVILAYIRSRCLNSPFSARHLHTNKRIFIFVFGVFVLAFVVHAPSFFHIDFKLINITVSNNSVEVCGIVESSNFILSPCTSRKVHVLMETLLDSLIPCCLLLYCNLNIFIILQRATVARTSMRSNNPASEKTTSSKQFVHFVKKCSMKDNIQTCDDSSCVLSMKEDTDCLCSPLVVSKKKRDNRDFHYNMKECVQRKDLLKFNGTKKGEGSCRSDEEGIENLENCDNTKEQITHETNYSACNSSVAKRKKTKYKSSYEKLNTDSRRTSWLIFAVSSMLMLSEIPLVITNIYWLITYIDQPLPWNFYGCMSVFLSLWQYITYQCTFLIYAGMSGTFRAELKKSLTCPWRTQTSYDKEEQAFLSPCSIRKNFNLDVCQNEDIEVDNTLNEDT